jgi:1-acyl-sn-glycerol-3-phosphate acyltransferase
MEVFMLHYLFLALAAIATVALYLITPTISLLWILPLFVAAFVGVILLYLLFLFVASLFLSQKKKITAPKAFCAFMIRITMDWLMRLFRIRIKLTGTEKIPDEPCIIVSNHRSDFDPMTVLAVLKGRKLSYISKDANFRIPIVGNFIHHAGFLAIDRGNGMRAMRTLKQAAEMMKVAGVDIGIYPEGTRSKTGELLRFRPGAFVLAKRADAPIVIMTTKGTELISKNVPFRSTNVELEIIGVIDRETLSTMEQDEISTVVRDMIEENLK